MSYPQPSASNSSGQDSERKVTREFNPFEVPFEVILYELNVIAREFCLTPLQSLLSEGFEDLDDLKAAIAEMDDKQLARRLLAEIDIIIDEYRKGVALL
ncbi:hypothetical protein [Endozoicomonas lisbonensis]|uniref:Uncharacterized protein n=1 Tax=Endozoicomonas lisbonensis TaxID=3120522 RepID=A0ABV2SGC5_9GAMM